jgi:cellulose synthase/poly-beta-1,6-N-acetylglucosamine synthase-like glycosyltransferase
VQVNSEQPLISFLVIAYQQDQYIREAVRSAFAQTYEPLEIILSDDCSSDATFEIMQEEAHAYRGAHRVVLHRTQKNSGLAQNLNEAWSHAQGELVVVQAGDDISLPQRTEVLYRAWRQPTQVDCVFSNCSLIDGAGKVLCANYFGSAVPRYSADLDAFSASRFCWIQGCSAAYSTHLNSQSNALPADVLSEDSVLAFRALLGRGIRYVSEPLVLYRRHDTNIFSGKGLETGKASSSQTIRWNQNRVAVAKEWVRQWQLSGLQKKGFSEILIEIERDRKFEYMASASLRIFLPFIALRGVFEGLSIIQAAKLIKRYLIPRRS